MCDLLKAITKKAPKMITTSAAICREERMDIAGMLKKYGPGLVSQFRCHKNFCRASNEKEVGLFCVNGNHGSVGIFQKLSRDGHLSVVPVADERTPQPKSPPPFEPPKSSNTESIPADTTKKPTDQERHAMILIGARKKGKKTWLLFQNWWSDMQVVEVSQDYFENSDACLTFVKGEVSQEPYSYDELLNGGTFNASPIADCNNLDTKDDPSNRSPFGESFDIRSGCSRPNF